MQFTGRNLDLVARGLRDALAEIHNQIATCPDVFEHADSLDDLYAEQTEYQRLASRVAKAIEREALNRKPS